MSNLEMRILGLSGFGFVAFVFYIFWILAGTALVVQSAIGQ